MPKYTSKDSLKSGVPLGGIGAGKIEIFPNGTLDLFTFLNNWDAPFTEDRHKIFSKNGLVQAPPEGILGYHFGIFTEMADDKKTAKLLQTVPIGNYPIIEEIKYEGLFPFARLNYIDKQIPIKVSLEAFSPFIPQDSKNSSIPGVIFNFRFHNPTDSDIKTSLLVTARNLTGNWQVGRFNTIKKDNDIVTLNLLTKKALISDYANGNMCISMKEDQNYSVSYLAQWNLIPECFKFNRQNIKLDAWDYFAQDGELPNIPQDLDEIRYVQSENNEIAGALCVKFDLKKGQTKDLKVIFAWYYFHPDRTHFYQNRFKDSNSVTHYLVSLGDSLHKKTTGWQQPILNLDIPDWLKDALINNLYPLVSSSWFDKEGNFAICEAPSDIALMGTLDVRYSGSIPQALFFPDLEKQEILQFAHAQRPSGYIPHDLGKKRLDMPSDGTTFYPWKDLNTKFILTCYRDYLWTQDKMFLKRLYPNIKRAIEWINAQDKDDDSLPENDGLDQTYDTWEFHGVNSYTSSIYLTSLLALEKMAQIMQDKKTEEMARQRFNQARKSFIEKLWSGRYFIACDGSKGKDLTCTIGQLNGQWYAHLLDLGYIVDKDKVKLAIETALSLNGSISKYGMLNSVLPDRRIDTSSPQSQSIWPGETYVFCALAIYEGYIEQAVSMAEKTWRNFTENIKSPWDQPDMLSPQDGRFLFGDHYMRNMCIWAILLALAKKDEKVKSALTYICEYSKRKF